MYIDEDRYVHKICRIGQYGSLRRFFDRIIIENMICPVASLWIEGFGRDTESDFVVLMRQRFFRQANSLTEEEIDHYMARLGFQKTLADDQYRGVRYKSGPFVIGDLHPGNIWQTKENNVVIIDGFFAFDF